MKRQEALHRREWAAPVLPGLVVPARRWWVRTGSLRRLEQRQGERLAEPARRSESLVNLGVLRQR